MQHKFSQWVTLVIGQHRGIVVISKTCKLVLLAAVIGSTPAYFARFSPDGKRIAYVAGKFPESAVYIANADGSGAVRVTK